MSKYKKENAPEENTEEKNMRLNQYLAHSGIGTRRQAGEWVKKGEVAVNGKVETNPAYRVQPEDQVTYKGESVSPEEKKAYFLFNKPKNTTTATSGSRGQKSVTNLLQNKVKQKVSPVERMEPNTTGLLLLTNDHAVIDKLNHPNHQMKQVYKVTLKEELEETDFEKIQKASEPDSSTFLLKGISYIEKGGKNELGVDLRKGSDKQLRQLFERLGYIVQRLDRVAIGGMTKKDLPRGFVRPLTKKEVIWLKHFL